LKFEKYSRIASYHKGSAEDILTYSLLSAMVFQRVRYVSLLFSDFSSKADVAYKNIKIQQDTTTTELIRIAMQKFGIEVIIYVRLHSLLEA